MSKNALSFYLKKDVNTIGNLFSPIEIWLQGKKMKNDLT